MEKKGFKAPECTKTGTTLAAMVFKDGVILGADTRSTAGDVVASKNCQKLHNMAPNIYCAGAGVAADTEHVTGMVASALNLHRYDTGRQTRVVTAMTLLKSHLRKYQGYIGAALIVGGVDLDGPHLFVIYPHGSVDSSPFASMGSGSLNSMAVLESGYRDDMPKEEAMELVARAIKAGIYNDNGSGSNVDLAILTKGDVELRRPYMYLQERTFVPEKPIAFPKGTTPILKEGVVSLKEVAIMDGDAMDTS